MAFRTASRADLALLVVLAALWGGAFTQIKVAVETIPPATLTAGRTAIAALVLLALLGWRGVELPRLPGLWVSLLVQAIINLVLPFLLISWGERHVSSGLAAILTTTAPLFAFAIAAAAGHGHRGPSQVFGLACGFAGVLAIVGLQSLTEIGGSDFPAQLAVIGAGFCYGSAANYGRTFRNVSPLVVGAGTMVWAAVLTVPLAIVLYRPWSLHPSGQSLAALASLGLFSTALAFTIYFRLLGRIGTIATSTVGYLRVGFSVLLGIVLLGERLTLPVAIGLLLIMLGVAAINGQLPRIGKRGWRRQTRTR